MPKRLDITGHRYDRLLVVDYAIERSIGCNKHWNCVCDCGTRLAVCIGNLRNGHTRSCGCYDLERKTIHGMVNTPLYKSWMKMMNRCTQADHEFYYWGRGISVCEQWKIFINFHSDMASTHFEGAFLDRIDSNGNYEKSNCRWVSTSMSAFNQRKSILNTSGCSGVNPKRKNWSARICRDKNVFNLGTFTSKSEAVKARLEAELKYYGEYKEKDKIKLSELLEFAGILNKETPINAMPTL